jgi:hypothetical protein
VYCPQGSSSVTAVLEGHFSTPEGASELTRSSQAIVSSGASCVHDANLLHQCVLCGLYSAPKDRSARTASGYVWTVGCVLGYYQSYCRRLLLRVAYGPQDVVSDGILPKRHRLYHLQAVSCAEIVGVSGIESSL